MKLWHEVEAEIRDRLDLLTVMPQVETGWRCWGCTAERSGPTGRCTSCGSWVAVSFAPR